MWESPCRHTLHNAACFCAPYYWIQMQIWSQEKYLIQDQISGPSHGRVNCALLEKSSYLNFSLFDLYNQGSSKCNHLSDWACLFGSAHACFAMFANVFWMLHAIFFLALTAKPPILYYKLYNWPCMDFVLQMIANLSIKDPLPKTFPISLNLGTLPLDLGSEHWSTTRLFGSLVPRLSRSLSQGEGREGREPGTHCLRMR